MSGNRIQLVLFYQLQTQELVAVTLKEHLHQQICQQEMLTSPLKVNQQRVAYQFMACIKAKGGKLGIMISKRPRLIMMSSAVDTSLLIMSAK